MFGSDFTSLGLRAASAGAAGSWRTAIDRLLAMLADVVADAELGGGAGLHHGIEKCRQVVALGAEPSAVDPLLDECMTLCRQALAGLKGQRLAQKREIAALVTLVREALAAVAGDTRTFTQSLRQSVERLEEFAKVDDVRELQRQLLTEVQVLRHMAAERERSWKETCEQFSRRVEALEQQLTAARREATLDPLTRVPNRAAFEASGRQWLAAGRLQFILAIVDVDNLKIINDQYGHAAGDRAILAVARALTSSLRAGVDLVARIGGDEFAVLAADLPLHQAENRMQMLIASLAQAAESADGDTPSELTLSCGIAECSAGDTLESLTERAEVALYQAKRFGKNRVVTVVKPPPRSLMSH
jgi:diguanylate cyclase